MKDKVKKVLCALIVVCICGGTFLYVQNVLEREGSRYASFFEQKEDFQVLFFGTSHVTNGIYPMELWNDYGIISYNFGGHSNTMAVTYWAMMNALDYTSPNVIVVDCSSLSSLNITSSNVEYVHYSLDPFPISDTKSAAVKDLLQSDTQLEFLWTYWTYHFRWNELKRSDFKKTDLWEKGAQSRVQIGVPNEVKKLDRSDKYEEDTIGVEYLRKIIEECKSRNIDVLLTYLPFPASEKKQREANRAYDIAEEYGINYLNFLDMDVVNYNTDCYDEDSHLNPSGARKVTDYLGQYLQENYNVPDQRENIVYSDWHEVYAAYETSKINMLKEQTTLDTYLMLLADQNYNAVIEINNPDIWKAERYLNLFENLGVNLSALSEETDFVVVQEGGKHADTMDNFRQNGSVAETSIGELSFFVAETGNNTADTYGVYLSSKELYTVTTKENSDEDEAKRADIRISVMDKDTLETVDYVTFSYTVDNQPEQNFLSTIGRTNP